MEPIGLYQKLVPTFVGTLHPVLPQPQRDPVTAIITVWTVGCNLRALSVMHGVFRTERVGAVQRPCCVWGGQTRTRDEGTLPYSVHGLKR